MTLLQRLADPKLLEQMTIGEKLNASLQTTVLGMGITFVALLFIWAIALMLAKIVENIENKEKVEIVETKTVQPASKEEVGDEITEELVAVIAASIASSLNTSIQNIVVKDIVRVEDTTPAWGRIGRVNQINSNL